MSPPGPGTSVHAPILVLSADILTNSLTDVPGGAEPSQASLAYTGQGPRWTIEEVMLPVSRNSHSVTQESDPSSIEPATASGRPSPSRSPAAQQEQPGIEAA